MVAAMEAVEAMIGSLPHAAHGPRMIERVVDELDGSQAAETVSFGLDGIAFEIDLNKEHAADLRTRLDPYVQAARLSAATAVCRRAYGALARTGIATPRSANGRSTLASSCQAGAASLVARYGCGCVMGSQAYLWPSDTGHAVARSEARGNSCAGVAGAS